MSCDLIVMLTWHDVTVADAKEIFIGAKDAPAKNWGFKIEGTTPQSMADLVKCMKDNGKTVYIEILAIDEPHCLKAAELCAECCVDHVLGTVYYDSVARLLHKAGIAYSPFVGLSDDTRLRGSIGSIIEKAQDSEKKDIFGINLSAFRYVDGDPHELLTELAPKLTKPFSIAGSVDSFEKLDFIKTLPNLYAFTIGGAFFEEKFGVAFSEQIEKVVRYINA